MLVPKSIDHSFNDEVEQVMLPTFGSNYSYPLWFGGSASCCAVCLTHPLDLIKVRMQTSPLRAGMFSTVLSVTKSDGLLGIYNGLSAGIARQLMYGSTRFAIYETIKNKYKRQTQQEASVSVKICAAAFSGFIGGIVGNPADLANVRMQSDSALPPNAQRHYKSVVDAFVRFKQEEGWRGYTRGIWANSSRALIITTCQLASYDAFKDILISKAQLHDSLGTHFAASVLAGLVATTICNPVDVIKSRIMSLSETRSILYVARHLWHTEGTRWLFRGWAPSFIRTGPHTVATFMFLEQHKKIYRSLLNRRQ